jgi:hypothetical protein
MKYEGAEKYFTDPFNAFETMAEDKPKVYDAFNTLPREKQLLFNIDKSKYLTTQEEILENAEKALQHITREDYEAFRAKVQECTGGKYGEEYTDTEAGFLLYLHSMLIAGGYAHLLVVKYLCEKELENPDILKAYSEYSEQLLAICKRAAAKVYKQKEYTLLQVDLYQQPNDKITKNLSTATEEELSRGQLVIDEKVGNIFSYINLYPEEVKKMGLEHINTFDLFVLFSCISIKAAGNTHTTINIIYKTMTGKSGEVKLTEKMRQELMQSIDKLRLTPITIDATGICAKYNHKPRGRYVKSYLLPAKMAGRGIVNGGYTEDVITFLDDSPLYEIARMKNNQIFSINRDVFDVPKLKANKQNLTLRQVLATLIYDAGHSAKINDGIRVDTLVERSEWSGTRARLVEAVEKCLEYWVEKQYLIRGYRIQKDKRGMAIKIDIEPLKN